MSAYLDENGELVAVSATNLLPVEATNKALPVLKTTGTLDSLNAYIEVAITEGYKTVEAWCNSGNFSGTLSLTFSFDGGTTYPSGTYSISKRMDDRTTTNSLVFTGSGIEAKSLRASVPICATHVRFVVSAYTSGSANVTIAQSETPYVVQVNADAVLGSGTNRIGFMARAAVWTRESTTPVNANLTITGAAKTTFATSSGTALNTSTSYGDKFAAAAGANVVGTLIIDASPDSGTTYYPVASVALTQIGGAGNFGAYLETPIIEATMRARLVNGASNQANAYLTTKMLG